MAQVGLSPGNPWISQTGSKEAESVISRDHPSLGMLTPTDPDARSLAGGRSRSYSVDLGQLQPAPLLRGIEALGDRLKSINPGRINPDGICMAVPCETAEVLTTGRSPRTVPPVGDNRAPSDYDDDPLHTFDEDDSAQDMFDWLRSNAVAPGSVLVADGDGHAWNLVKGDANPDLPHRQQLPRLQGGQPSNRPAG
jgi:hypothetical protein